MRRVVEPLLYLFILVLLGSRIHLACSTIHWAAEGESGSDCKTIRCLHLCDLLQVPLVLTILIIEFLLVEV